MRIQNLSLDLFGKFTGKTFDFGKGDTDCDFHVIYGLNEAGKTTTMEGYLRLLYGFPQRDPYDFRHGRPNLKVSGTLNLGGDLKRFSRLTTRTGNLVDASNTAVTENAILAHLGGLSSDDYRSLLCLDDDTIEKGGEDIVKAKGDIGRLLFSAAAGIADLNEVLEQAHTAADELHRKRSSKTRMAELKRGLSETDDRIRMMDVPAHKWKTLKAKLKSAEQEEKEARTARDEVRKRQADVSALGRAIPLLGEHDRLVENVADFAEYPPKLDINPEELVELKTARGRCADAIDRLNAEIDNAKAELVDVHVDKDGLALASRLDDLDALRGRWQTADFDLERRRGELRDVETEMRRCAGDLGAPGDIKPEKLVASPADIKKIENVHDAMGKAKSRCETETGEVAELEHRMRQERKSLEAMSKEAGKESGVVELLAKFDVDSLLPAVAVARLEIEEAEAALAQELGALASNAREFQSVPDRPIDVETAADLADRHDKLAEQIARADDKRATRLEEYESCTAKLENQTSSAGVADDDAAQEAMESRDELWQTHLGDLTRKSAAAFHKSMVRTDEIAGARLANAQSLSAMRQLTSARAEAKARLKATSDSLEELRAQATKIEERASKISKSLGIGPVSPKGLAAWVARQSEAAAAEIRVDQLGKKHRRVIDQADQLLQALLPFLSLEDPDLDSALLAARRLAEDERRITDDRKAARVTLDGLKKDLDDRTAKLAAFQKDLQKVMGEWDSLVKDIFANALDAKRLALDTTPLREIRESDAKRVRIARQVNTMEDDQARFLKAMSKLGDQYGQKNEDPLEMYRQLGDICESAEKSDERRLALKDQIEIDERALEEAREGLRDMDRKVAAHASYFPKGVRPSDIDELRRAVVKANEIIDNRNRIVDLKEQILNELSKENLESVRNQLGHETAPELEAKARALESDLEQAENRLNVSIEAHTNARRDLGDVVDDVHIADLVERRTTFHLQIEETTLEYLEWQFGLRLAEEAIRRYRDKHRSAMMEATERAFIDLTDGAYERLNTRPDGKSDVLVAIDSKGAAKQIADLSKGTRFQLYLALRAAAYEQMAKQGIALPFFCDDVFETFDENRTGAACRLMEWIGRSGQAIYLTHHRHVVDIAKEVCKTQPTVHEL